MTMTAEHVELLDNSINKLKSTMSTSIPKALADSLRNLQGLFGALGVEIGDTTNKILNIGTSALGLADSLYKLSKTDKWKKLTNSFSALSITIGNSWVALKSKIATFAKFALPIIVVTALIAGLALGIRHLWNNNEGFRDFVIGAWERIRNVFSTVIGFIQGLFTDFGGTMSNLGESFRNFFSNIDPAKAFDIFKNFIPTIIAKLVGGIPGLLIKGISIISSIADGMGKTLPELIQKGTEIIVGFINKIVQKLPEILNTGVEILVSLIDGVLSMIPKLIEIAITLITTVIEMIVQNLPLIIDAGINILTSLIEGIVQVLPALIEAAINLITSILNALIENLSMIIQAGIDILMALIEGIIQVLPELIEAAINLIISIMNALIENLPMIIQAGIDILMALIEGIIQVLPALIEAAINLIIQVVQALIENLPQIIAAGVQILKALIEGIWSIVSNLASIAWDLITNFVSSISERISSIKEIGREIVQGLINGITGMFGRVAETVGNLASNIFGGIRNFFGINSPSRLMKDKIGKPIVEGVAKGIDDNAGIASKSIYDLGNEMESCMLEVADDVGKVGEVYGNNIVESATNADYSTIPEAVAQAIEDGQDAMIQPVEKTVYKIVNTFEEGMADVETTATGSFESLGEVMTEGMLNVTTVMETGLYEVKEVFSTGMDAVKEITDTGILSIEELFEAMQEPIQTSSKNAMEQLDIELMEGMKIANETAADGITQLEDTFNTLEDSMNTIGNNAMLGIKNGLSAKKPAVMAMAQSIADSVSQTIASALKINSPSRVMESLGGYTMEGFANGMEDGQKEVEDVAENTADTVKDEFSKAAKMQQKLGAISAKLYKAKKEFANSAASLVQDGVSQALNMQQKLSKMLSENHIAHELSLSISPPDASYQSSLMERLIDVVEAGRYIVMDSGELVGATYSGYDNAAGQAISYNARWGR